MRQIYTQGRNKLRIDEAIIHSEGSNVNTQRRNKLRIDEAIIHCEGSDINTEYTNQILHHLKHATLTHTRIKNFLTITSHRKAWSGDLGTCLSCWLFLPFISFHISIFLLFSMRASAGVSTILLFKQFHWTYPHKTCVSGPGNGGDVDAVWHEWNISLQSLTR